MGRIIDKEIDGLRFRFHTIPGSIALPHAPRAQAHFLAANEAAAVGLPGPMQLAAMLKRLDAAEVRFWCDLLVWSPKRGQGQVEVEVDSGAGPNWKPLKVALDAELIPGGIPTIEKALLFAMDLNCGPFGGLGDLFRVLDRPEEAPEEEPSSSSESETSGESG